MTRNTLPLFTPEESVPLAAQHQINATLVPDVQRMGFCADYNGGIWNFYTLSNGGAFMAPEAENSESWSLFNTMNGNGGELSAEAAGIAVCLMAYSHHACRTECDAMTEHYYRLRDYALNHAECGAIMHIID
ncbi:antirestriction protein [Enterobacter hormaechei]